jgi:hypothetical protein
VRAFVRDVTRHSIPPLGLSDKLIASMPIPTEASSSLRAAYNLRDMGMRGGTIIVIGTGSNYRRRVTLDLIAFRAGNLYVKQICE